MKAYLYVDTVASAWFYKDTLKESSERKGVANW